MMQVRVRLFARARDLAGADVVTVEMPDGARVGELRPALGARFPRLASLLEHSALAVADEFADDSTALAADTEVALLPPVSGG